MQSSLEMASRSLDIPAKLRETRVLHSGRANNSDDTSTCCGKEEAEEEKEEEKVGEAADEI